MRFLPHIPFGLPMLRQSAPQGCARSATPYFRRTSFIISREVPDPVAHLTEHAPGERQNATLGNIVGGSQCAPFTII